MYRAPFLAACAATASAFAPASGVLPKTASARAAVARGPSMQDRFAYKTSCGYDIQAPYWAENGGIFGWPDVIRAREAEVKHGRIAMLAATGLIVQDLFTFPFYGKWYGGEKVWALHDKLVEVGAAKQVLALLLAFSGLLRISDVAGLRVQGVVFPEDARFWGVSFVMLALEHTKTGDDSWLKSGPRGFGRSFAAGCSSARRRDGVLASSRVRPAFALRSLAHSPRSASGMWGSCFTRSVRAVRSTSST